MRIDKYIWHVRLFKTRSKATKACKEGKVLVNGERIKPAFELQAKDLIGIRKSGVVLEYRVLGFPANRIGAALVPDYLEDCTTEEVKAKLKTIQVAQKQYRNYGTGKPSKKDRRALQKFFKS